MIDSEKMKKFESILERYGVKSNLEKCKKEILGLLVCEWCFGSKQRKCTRCKGEVEYKETCFICKGTGKETKKRKVTGFMPCSRCEGSGREPKEYLACEKCDGSGEMVREEEFEQVCSSCDGSRFSRACSMCSGKLTIKCYKCT